MLSDQRKPTAARTRARFAGHEAMPELGWDAVTVPGAVAAWATLVQRFGRLSLPEIAAPAIRFAREGFAVGPIVATLWARGAETLEEAQRAKLELVCAKLGLSTGERVLDVASEQFSRYGAAHVVCDHDHSLGCEVGHDLLGDVGLGAQRVQLATWFVGEAEAEKIEGDQVGPWQQVERVAPVVGA